MKISDLTLNFFSRHLQALLKACGDISRRPFSSIMVVMVLAIALTIPTSLGLLVRNLQVLSQGFHPEQEISVYLKMGVSAADAQLLIKKWRGNSSVISARYISPDEGLNQFRQATGFNDIIHDLPTNPLPGVIVIKPDDISQINDLVSVINKSDQVDQVQLNYAWLDRLNQISEIAKHIVIFLGVILTVGVVLIVWNTIHLIMQEHYREISIYQLVGATRAFIRRPYLYMGLLYGLFSGFLAWLTVTFTLFWLKQPIQKLVLSYGTAFQLDTFGFSGSILFLLFAALLGFLGAVIALQKPLRQG